MSKQLEVYVDGNKLNVEDREGFPVSIDYSIESAEDPSKVNGSHSKRSVSFPGDGVSASFFEGWANVTRQNPNAANRKPSRIDVNSLTVLSGVAQIDQAETSGNKYDRYGSGYRAGIFGNNAAWFDDVKNIRIREMGLLPAHDLTSVYVSNNDNANPDTDDFGYFVVRWSDWRGGGVNVSYVDMQPFLFVRAILTEAFRLAGYIFQSDFFDTFFGKRLILPVLFRSYPEEITQKLTVLVMDDTNGTPINSSTYTKIPINGDKFLYNPSGYYNTTTGYYTVPISGYYIVGVETSTANFTHRARKNDVDLGLFTDPCEIGIGVQKRVLFEEGDTISLYMLGNFSPAAFCFLYVRADLNAFDEGTGVRFDWYGNPEWKVSDVILGLTHAFGLVWNTDYDAQKVVCEPRDRYKISEQPSTTTFHEGFYRVADRLDISSKVDFEQSGAVVALNNEKESTVLAWKSDSADANLEAAEKDAVVPMYDGKYTYPEGRFRKGESRSENPFFAKTIHLFDNAIKHATSTKTPQIPYIAKERFGTALPFTEERGDFAPRLLWFAGRRGGIDGLVNLEDLAAYDFPAAFMVNYADITGLDPSLAFSNETMADEVTVTPGLLQRFHFQRLKRLEVGKIVKEWILWRDVDVMTLDFRRKILIGDALFLLQQISGYQPIANDSTETELLYDAVPEDSDTTKISGSDIDGYIISPVPNGE